MGNIFDILGSYLSVVSIVVSITALLVVAVGAIAFVKRSAQNGVIRADRERTKQLYEENNYLTNKNNYLIKKIDDIESDHQRQINNLSREVSEIFNRINQPQAPQIPQIVNRIKPYQPVPVVDDDDEVTFELPRERVVRSKIKRPDDIGRQLVQQALADFTKSEENEY